MDRLHLRLPRTIRIAVSTATLFGMFFSVSEPALAAETATFAGTVISPSNAGASGFTVGFRDVASDREFRSEPTGDTGSYRVIVPVSGRYKLDVVQAPDGTRLAVQNLPPVAIRGAGTNRVDIKFGGAGTLALAPAATADDDKKKSGATPWWKKPGPIIGLVLGSLALAAVAVEVFDDSDDVQPSVSPSAPSSK
jgi:hypothetical protein